MPPLPPPTHHRLLSEKRAPFPNDFTLNNFRKLAKIDIHTLSTDEFIKHAKRLTEFFDKLVNIVGIERNDILPIYRQIHEGMSRLVGSPESDKDYAREIESLTALFSSISKSQVFIKFPLAHDHIMIFQQLGMALITSLTKQVGYKTDSSLESYFSAASESMINHEFLTQEYSQIARSLFNIGYTCFTANNCNHKLAFNETLSLLGDMTHKLDTPDMSYTSKEILQHVLTLQKEATKQLTPNQITEASYLFLNNAYSEQNATTIASKCAELFPNHCHFLPEPAITSTATPSTSTSRANSTLSTPTLTPTEQTEVTTLATLPTSPTESTTFVNEQSSDLPRVNKSNLTQKLTSGAIIGFGMGVKDELLEALRNACVNTAIEKKYSALAINSIKTTFWLINTFSTTAIPLLYSYIYNIMLVDEEQDPLNSSQLIISTSICFSLEALYAATYLLPENSNYKKALDYIKFPLVFSFLFASSENIGENAIVFTAGGAAGALAKKLTKAVTQGIKGNFFKENKLNNPKALEEGIELLPKSPSDSVVSGDSNVRYSDISSNAETVSSNSSSGSNRSYYFLTFKNLLDLRTELNSIEKNLNKFLENCKIRIDSLTHTIETEGDETRKSTMQVMLASIKQEYDLVDSILNKKIITVKIKSFSQLEAIAENLNDPIHEAACKGFTTEIDIAKDPDIELSNSFLMQVKKDIETLKTKLSVHSKHGLIQEVLKSSTSISSTISVNNECFGHNKTALRVQNSKASSQTMNNNPNNLWSPKNLGSLANHGTTADNRRFSSRY